MIYEKALKERERLEKRIFEAKQELKGLPDGKLLVARNGKGYRWYQSDGHTQMYLPRKERALAEQLAIKRYLLSRIKEMEHEKSAIEFYLRHHNNSNKVEQMINDSSEYI